MLQLRLLPADFVITTYVFEDIAYTHHLVAACLIILLKSQIFT